MITALLFIWIQGSAPAWAGPAFDLRAKLSSFDPDATAQPHRHLGLEPQVPTHSNSPLTAALVAFWVGLAVLMGWLFSGKGYSFAFGVMIGLFVSPVIALIIYATLSPKNDARLAASGKAVTTLCPSCSDVVSTDDPMCPSCGRTLL